VRQLLGASVNGFGFLGFGAFRFLGCRRVLQAAMDVPLGMFSEHDMLNMCLLCSALTTFAYRVFNLLSLRKTQLLPGLCDWAAAANL
jgi:hypothetical protein